ncbi:40S ribosomal protein S25 [Candidatus Bathyarchaeota archaeon]|nr:40S ribosomal protein S25 [Candidatus Bathyarchaeota archaeon]
MAPKKKTTVKKNPAKRSTRTQREESKKPEKKSVPPRTSGQPLQLDLSPEELSKELGKIKAITPYAVASRFEINLGEAKRLLRDLEEQDLIKCVGGNSRIRIYISTAS